MRKKFISCFKIINAYSQNNHEKKIFDEVNLESKFTLKRQDDNGNIFVVGTFPTHKDAENKLKELTRNVHKQHYWIENSEK